MMKVGSVLCLTFILFSNGVNSGRAGEADARGRQTHDDESRIRFVSYFHSF
jgi:hypothetical protein